MPGTFSPTGNEIVDSLVMVQLSANEIRDPETKTAHLRRAVAGTAARSLLEGVYEVNTAMAFGRSPDMPPDHLMLYQRNIKFLGQLVDLRYLADFTIPVDALAFSFSEPILLGAEPRDVTGFMQQRLYVPVLAITS